MFLALNKYKTSIPNTIANTLDECIEKTINCGECEKASANKKSLLAAGVTFIEYQYVLIND